ncbi:hypothetical protein [Pseudaminobacter salicylatoxidans]|uniref:hypothetical protein n=1 Tax=Pseudaminobacter salicylatoxidans TaxID=93369 RepID=UPI00037705D9|nr:hypothetical protein [Pseudaminobacter salicylatoxidans]
MQHNLDQWPFVVTTCSGRASLDELRAFFAAGNGWLDRGEPFVSIRHFVDNEALEHPEGGARETKAWFQQNAGRIRQQMLGMVTIVPESAYDQMSRMDAEKLFGIPAGTFSNIDAALHWLDERVIAPRSLAFDRDAIRNRLVRA